MASKRNSLSASFKSLRGFGANSQATTTNLSGSVGGLANTMSLKAGAPSNLKSASFNSADRQATSIDFGKAHIKTSVAAGSEWKQLLGQVASGGLASFFGSGLLSSGGIHTLVSGLESLFGSGKSSAPAVTAFQLPASQNQTVSIGNQSTSANFQDHSSAIAQAVKTAILQSSSLNDVIAEL